MQIKITGLRPGEKLYEEILMNEEGLEATKHDKIHVAEPLNITMEQLEEKLDKLDNLLETSNNEDKDTIKKTMKQIVPTYRNLEEEKKEKVEQVVETKETNKEKTDKETTITLIEKGKKVIEMNKKEKSTA